MQNKNSEYEIEKYLYNDKSSIAGTGLFSTKDFKKGEVAFVMKGEIIKFHPKNREETMNTPNLIGLDKELYLDPISPYVYMNHHCNPNLGVDADDGVSYVAIRDIKAGEELTFDYSISEYSDWDMNCSCDYKNCRKVIKSIDKLPKDFFDKYLPFIPKYFQGIYLENYIKNNK
jgi:hypothetical protein